MAFTHLHVHTEFSLLDGSNKIKEYVARVKELGMNSAAITDHGVMFGVIDFYKAAKAAGTVPVQSPSLLQLFPGSGGIPGLCQGQSGKIAVFRPLFVDLAQDIIHMGGSFIVLKTIFGFCPVFQDIHLKVCDPVCGGEHWHLCQISTAFSVCLHENPQRHCSFAGRCGILEHAKYCGRWPSKRGK